MSGRLAKRLAVYGAQIDEKGVVDFGVLPAGQGAKAKLLLRVRDEDPKIKVRAITVQPDFVKADVTPFVDSTGVAKAGLYHFNVEVPPSAPVCNHMGLHQAPVELKIDHPRISGVTIKLNFAVKTP